MKVKIDKPIEAQPFFMVVNSVDMLWEGYEKEINTVVLNDTDTTEFIKVLRKSRNKSIKYGYLLCVAPNMPAIEGLRELVAFMRSEGFNYYISPEQTEMYRQVIIEHFNKCLKESVAQAAQR